jgi:Arabinose efflux permease
MFIIYIKVYEINNSEVVFTMKNKYVYVSLLFLVFFIIGCDTFIVSPLITFIAASLHINPNRGGFLVTFYSIFYVIFSPLLGPFSDRIGRKKMICIGIIIFSISTFATGFTNNYFFILLARSIAGIGAAFTAPNVWSFIGDIFEYKERGKFTAIIASGLSLGMILGVPIGSFLAQWKGWSISFYAMGVLSLLVGLFILITFPSIKASDVILKPKYSEQFGKVLKHNNILFSFIVTFLISFANFGLYTYLGYWINKCFSLSVSKVGILMIVAGLGNLIGMQIGGF